MKHDQTLADRMFAGYAAQHGYEAVFEPSWKEEFGCAFRTDPDFLVSRDGTRTVVEVREFKTRALTNAFAGRGGGAFNPAIVRKPLYAALAEKARKLEHFAMIDAPLVIALANPGGADVDLSDYEMTCTMFGESPLVIPVSPSGEGDLDAAQYVAEAGYGVFRGTDADGEPRNLWPHVSGVAVLGRFDLYSEFQSADLRRYVEDRGPADRREKMALAAEWAGTPVGRHEAPGPTGFDYSVTYYDLAGYALGSGPPVLADWFTGPRDRRFGFDSQGIDFGPTSDLERDFAPEVPRSRRR